MEFHNFNHFLTAKNIDHTLFYQREKERYKALATYFMMCGEKNFTYEKLFLFNRLRRQYPIRQHADKK